MTDARPPRPSPTTLTTLPEILTSLYSLEQEENRLSDSLAAVLSDDEPVRCALQRLQSLAPHLDEISTDVRLLYATVSATARTAERVGGRVKLLDEEMSRVKGAAERVTQVMELKVRPLAWQFNRVLTFSSLQVLHQRSPSVHRKPGLGSCYSTLRPSNGTSNRGHLMYSMS